ncbi:MAG: hypothetical protein R3F65_23650 [bacterium]
MSIVLHRVSTRRRRVVSSRGDEMPEQTHLLIRGGTVARRLVRDEDAELVLDNPTTKALKPVVEHGLRIMGVGVTAIGLGVIEGRARAGKLPGWANMPNGRKVAILFAIFLGAGALDLWARKNGKRKTAALAQSISSTALGFAIMHATAGSSDGKVEGLGKIQRYDQLTDAELAALNAELSAEIAQAVDTMGSQEMQGLMALGDDSASMMADVHEAAAAYHDDDFI